MQKCLYTLLCNLFVAFFLPIAVNAAEPQNLDILKMELRNYYDTGDYTRAIAQVDARAECYLKQRVKENGHLPQPKKLAIVFDIDETLLSNYEDLKNFNFGGIPLMVDSNKAQAHDSAIEPSLHLYRLAQKSNVAIFLITGRKPYLRDATIKNLQQTGYTQWTGLIFKPSGYNKLSVAPFKSAARAHIAQAGYDIIINVGDQQSDLVGCYAEQTYKLPNPYYFVR
jgi:predicted secreted acid phosphatase